MARSGLQEALQILDPLQSWNWDVMFPRVPGIDDTRPLTNKAVSTNIPGHNIEQVGVEAKGVKLNFAGRRTWGGTWDCTFVESRDSNSRDSFVKWMELARSWKNNTGSYKSVYSVPIELTLYDDLPQVSRLIKLIGAWPMTVGETSLDQSSGVVQYAVTFSYDYTEE